MPRIFLPVGALACWTLLIAACSDKATIIDLDGTGGTRAGSAGRSGSTGVGGSRAGAGGSMAGTGGSAAGEGGSGEGGSAAGEGGSGGEDGAPDAGADSGEPACTVDSDCADDGDPCTVPDCNASQVCVTGNAAAGTLCGSAPGLCSGQDTCNAGLCLPNHTPNLVCDSADEGTEDDGHCTEAGVCDCASERLTAPGQTSWATASTDPDLVNLSCDDVCDNIPDHVVVFTAPSTGTYRFFAAASEGGEGRDTALAVMEGNCSPAPTEELGCNDDILGADALIADSELDVPLTSGQLVTVVVTTVCENEGGDGILRIELLPAD